MKNMIQTQAHIPAPQGEQSWYHRLPSVTLVNNRDDWLRNLVRGLRVAHVGFADVGCEITKKAADAWLHAKLHETSAELVGLDIVESAVESAVGLGFDAHAVDCTDPAAVEDLYLAPFDVVLLGEVIEHVDNPGGLIRAAGILCKPNGRLIVTTPNARRPLDVALAVVRRESIHPDHVGIYSVRTLRTLVERHGWSVETTTPYVNPVPPHEPRGARGRMLHVLGALQRRFSHLAPYCADGLILVAHPREHPHDAESGSL